MQLNIISDVYYIETNRSSSSRRSDKQDGSARDKKDAKGTKDKDRSGSKPDRKTDSKVKTQITVTLDGDGATDQYDPANPTADEEYMETEDEIKVQSNLLMWSPLLRDHLP